MEPYFFITKKLLFLTFAEKRRITETAEFGGFGGFDGKMAVGEGDLYFYLFIYVYENKSLDICLFI